MNPGEVVKIYPNKWTCPKCGSVLIHPTLLPAEGQLPERLQYHCQCGYRFFMRPKDYP